MGNERLILCGGVEGPTKWPGLKEPFRLHHSGEQKNITLKIKNISSTFVANIDDIFVDLLEIASYVYCADQVVTRGGKTDPKMGENWRRHLGFYIPVRRLDFWEDPEVSRCLASTLGFLSDDYYSFTFSHLSKPPHSEQYFEGMEDETLAPEAIILFSGGLDSLAGAVQEAVYERKQVVLVSHRSAPKIFDKQQDLVRALAKRCLGPKPIHVPVWVTKHGEFGRENTQRSRSFLYASLGATVAHLFDISEIHMYENGVISLNLPISEQLVGARASRTTHPKVIHGFQNLFSLIMGKPFCVENPFLWETKADVVARIAAAGCPDLIEPSSSCSHVMEMTNIHSHCGKCSQCIDRRFAVLASGNEAYDPQFRYKVDLLEGDRETPEDKTMAESYIRTATEMDKMTEMEFFSRFGGEISRVLAHIDGTSDENAARIWDLHKRHAGQICHVIDNAIQNYAREIRKGTLSDSCLLILALHEKYRSSGEPPRSEKPQYAFRKRGNFWEIIFEGYEIHLNDEKGLNYISFLLRHPNREFHIFHLIQAVDGTPLPVDNEIFSQMSADRLDDEGLCIASLKEEQDKARKAVSNRITASRRKIHKENPALGQHLYNFIKTGFFCSYTPGNSISWEL